jgi:nicotinamide-nucleotide amidase
MKAVIISIGDELLIGQVINTNSAFIATHLNGAGVEIARVITVGDDLPAILDVLRTSVGHYDAVIITGGLGPTHDDITRTAMCRFFNTELVPSDEAKESVAKFLRQRNFPWSDSATNQTLIPRGARIIPNEFGTAPGELFERGGTSVIVMPGVPYEMESMITGFVVPYFAARSAGTYIIHRTLKTTGIAESALAQKLDPVQEIIGGHKLAFLPSPYGVRLRISVVSADHEAGIAAAADIEQKIRRRAGEFIYGTGDDELEEVLGRLLAEQKLTIAAAESCTGGLIMDRLTNVPGSSAYTERGVVAYSNASKTELLGVDPALITSFGAVSEEVARAMAEGIRSRSGVDIGLGVTGIAGPTGGTAEKPVGTVWIACSDSSGTAARRYAFGTGRRRVKQRASQAALEMVRRRLTGLG